MAKVSDPIIEWGVASQTVGNEAVSGDIHLVKVLPGKALVAVIDGVGHGEAAAEAAQIAADCLRKYAGDSLAELMGKCHWALIATRGAVISLAEFSAADNTMAWLGVGNVDGFLLRRNASRRPACEGLLPNRGLVGDCLPPLAASVLPVDNGDVLIFATDGIRPGFADRIMPSNPPQQIADQILAWLSVGSDDALVLVVRYVNGSRRDSTR